MAEGCYGYQRLLLAETPATCYILVVMDMITSAAEMIPITDKSAKTVACAVVHNILFILPLVAEWLEWCSIHSGIGMRNRKT